MSIGPAVATRRWRESGSEVLEVLASSSVATVATDQSHRILLWNRAAERLLGRESREVLGRRCHDVLGGRDVFGNRFCQEACTISCMTRRGDDVQGFELLLSSGAKPEQAVNVTVLTIPGERPESFTIVHMFQPIDRAARLARALESVGAKAPGAAGPPLSGAAPVPSAPPLTQREKEILSWVAAGLQNKEIAQKLDISLATVRNHIHNILEKLDVHSKLEAVSLAFRKGWVASGPASGR